MSARPILWTASQAAEATGGTVAGEWQAGGVSIDTRTLLPGDLFIALHGPNFDGHDFVADAFAKGAAAALVSKVPDGIGEDRLLVAGDTMTALESLGRAGRARLPQTSRVIAVTGSVGKTGTKEALRTVLAAQAATHATEGSLNNHWGLPLSLSRMPPDTAYGIFELGMNHTGEIEPLSLMARPHVTLITTIEMAHAEFFDSVEQIADAKAEIFAGIESGGAAVLNRDNLYFDRLAGIAAVHGIQDVCGFGEDARADVRLIDYALVDDGSMITADVAGTEVAYRLAVPGRHWVMNSLGVLCAVLAAGGDVSAAAESMEKIEAPAGRGQRHVIHLAEGSLTLIDESYNASPASMRAAFDVLGQAQPGRNGRRIAVLGDMLELGEATADSHTGLAASLTENGIDLVFTGGPAMTHLWEALPADLRGGHASNAEQLAALVTAAVGAGDVVTVKGSAGSRTGKVVEALKLLDAGENVPAKHVVNGS